VAQDVLLWRQLENTFLPVAIANRRIPIDAGKATDVENPAALGGQTDGATHIGGGSNLQEPDYTVDVKLSDMQADPDNPLYSIKTFEELGL
jgi:hypothetical protein